jgi:hypothetical protein
VVTALAKAVTGDDSRRVAAGITTPLFNTSLRDHELIPHPQKSSPIIARLDGGGKPDDRFLF